MKQKLVEKTNPIKTTKSGWWITVQKAEKILILNIYQGKKLLARHCIDTVTHEYATLKDGTWNGQKIHGALDIIGDYYYYSSKEKEKRFKLSEADSQLIVDALADRFTSSWLKRDPFELISNLETEYGRDKREQVEKRRIGRVNEVMNQVPDIPEKIKEWINQRVIGGEDYALKNKETGKWSCSKCGEQFEFEEMIKEDKTLLKNNDLVSCPCCNKKIRYLSRRKKVDIITHFALVQPIDDDISVVRHFDAEIYCAGGKKQIGFDESVRIILKKDDCEGWRKHDPCALYYNQYGRGTLWAPDCGKYAGTFDNKRNPANRGISPGYLYDEGIEEAFKNTAYETWGSLFKQLAAAGIDLNYNGLMVTKDNENFKNIIELLFRGRFYKLLKESSGRVAYWGSQYSGPLKLYGETIEDVFDLGDRQMINRIREKNGGESMLKWMKWSNRNHKKITDATLSWIAEHNIAHDDMAWLLCRMSPEQAMNYINRQKKESYKKMTVKQVISQYEDYMKMCERLNKNTKDEMVYRPRELKRRHDESVSQIERLNAEVKAEEYSKKFGDAEKVLEKIKGKLEYKGESFFIMVPERIVDIVAEGNYLHHCAGATDRYFDRIKQHETYVCFLRKMEEPEIPFYTIEVEPGGTIRQHRGMFDEEPEIEKVKPFLKEWQKEIRERMNHKDHERAAVAKVKREENIQELKKKNNTRVLEGLMEDLMEAM